MLATKLRRSLAGLLSAAMVFTFLGGTWGSAAPVENQIVHNGQKVTSPDGNVSVQKSIRQTGKDSFEITLTVDTKDKVTSYVKDASVDVVLVIDISNSMDNGRLTAAKNAAKTFVNTMLGGNVVTDSKIAVATYNNSGHTIKALSGDKDALIAAINGIKLDSNEQNGGTNIQAGIQQGQALLNAGQNENKYMVLLSDGVPTYSYKGTAAENSWLIPKVDGGNYGFRITQFSDERKGSGSSYKLSDKQEYSIGKRPNRKTIKDNIVPTLSQALLAKNAGTEIYSVLLMNQYDDDYKVADHVMKNTASDGDHYIGTDDLEELANIFKGFSEEIIEKTKVWQVTDPMNEFIQWGDFTVTVPSAAASYNKETGTLTWNMWHKSVVPESLGDNRYRYTLSYNITLDTAAKGFVEGKDYPTNKTTTLTYFIGEELTDESELETIDFDVPVVEGKVPVCGYTVEYYKQTARGYVKTGDTDSGTAKLWTTISAPNGYETKYDADNYQFNSGISQPSATFEYDGQVLKLYYDRIATSVTVNHHYTTKTITEDGTSSTTQTVPENPKGTFYAGEKFAAVLKPGTFTFVKADPSQTITLGKNAKDNVIDLYYEKTVDLRADASVQVIHHYTTKTWVVENGQSVLKESTNTVDGVHQTGLKAGMSYTATPVPAGFTRVTPDSGLTIQKLTGGENTIHIYYEKTVDARTETNVEVYHHYTTKTTVIAEDGSTVTNSDTKTTGPVVPEGSFYVGQKFTATPVPNGFTQVTPNEALTVILKQDGNRIDIYYEKQVDGRVLTTVTVNHTYTTYETFINDQGKQQVRESSYTTHTTPSGTFYVGQNFTAVPVPDGYTQVTSAKDLTIKLGPDTNVVNIEYEKHLYPDAANVTVYHHYITKTWVVENGQSVLKESTKDETGVQYNGYVGETYTAKPVPKDFKQITPDNSLTIKMEKGDNAIHITYEKIVDTRTPVDVKVYHRYTTKTWVIENGQSVLKTGEPQVEGPVIPEGKFYKGESFTATAVPKDFTQVTPDQNLTISLKDGENVVNIDYEKTTDARKAAAVEVYHHYKTITVAVVDGKVTRTESTQDMDGEKLTSYAGMSYTATPVPGDFTRTTPDDALTVSPLKEGTNRIDVYYEKTVNLTKDASVIVHHKYTTRDLAGGEPTVETITENEVKSFAGLSFTATQDTKNGLFTVTGVEPSLTIVLKEGKNEITIQYERTIDTRVSTDVVVKHRYVTYDEMTDTRTVDDETSETFSGRENGIFVGATFKAATKPREDYEVESITPESLVLKEAGNSVTIVYLRTVPDTRVSTDVVVHHQYVTYDEMNDTRTVDDETSETFSGRENGIYVGATFKATPKLREDYKVESITPESLVLKESGNSVTIVYLRTIPDTRVSTDVVVHHQYVTYDEMTDTRTVDDETSETFSGRENGIFVGATFSATEKPREGYAVESISADSIVLKESGNSITIVYLRTVDSRVSTDVVVHHQYVTFDQATNLRTTDDETSETFSGRENGIYVGATFSAEPKLREGYEVESISDTSIVLQESGNSITIVYVKTIDSKPSTEVNVVHQYVTLDESTGQRTTDEEITETFSGRENGIYVGATFKAATKPREDYEVESITPESLVLKTSGNSVTIVYLRTLVDIEDEDPPLAEPEDPVDSEPSTPTQPDEPNVIVDIPDDDVPLSDSPQTGETGALAASLAIAAAAAGLVVLTMKKGKQTSEQEENE